MNELDEIKKRINQRKSNKKVLTDHHFLKFYNLMIKSMVVLLVGLSVFTYLKITPNGQYISEHVLSDVNYNKVITWVNEQLFELGSDPSEEVSAKVSYKHVEDNLYTNNTNEVVNFSKGRVIYCGAQDLLGNYITILLNNNVEVTFGKLNDVFVSQFDQVEEGTIIGTCEEDVMIIFTQGEEEITYDAFMQLLEEN